MKPTATFKTVTLTQKQWEKQLVQHARHDGFLAACSVMKRLFSAPEHKAIRDIIDGVDHTQGDPSAMRMLRRMVLELKAKGRQAAGTKVKTTHSAKPGGSRSASK
jgi:hypothetical protein